MAMNIRQSKARTRHSSLPITWVVYRMTIHNKHDRICAICQQSEWDAMELARPGYHLLIREGIASEVEAEMLARRTATDGIEA